MRLCIWRAYLASYPGIPNPTCVLRLLRVPPQGTGPVTLPILLQKVTVPKHLGWTGRGSRGGCGQSPLISAARTSPLELLPVPVIHLGSGGTMSGSNSGGQRWGIVRREE